MITPLKTIEITRNSSNDNSSSCDSRILTRQPGMTKTKMRIKREFTDPESNPRYEYKVRKSENRKGRNRPIPELYTFNFILCKVPPSGFPG
jgi:hypothetical protein